MCRAADPVVQRLRRLRRKSEPDANERLGFVQSDTVEPVGGDDGFATKPAVQGRVMPGAGGRAPDALNEPSEAFGALCDSLHQEQERAPEDLGTNWDPGADAPALPPQEGRGAKAIERRESERSASDLPSCQQDASLRSASDRLTCQQEVSREVGYSESALGLGGSGGGRRPPSRCRYYAAARRDSGSASAVSGSRER